MLRKIQGANIRIDKEGERGPARVAVFRSECSRRPLTPRPCTEPPLSDELTRVVNQDTVYLDYNVSSRIAAL